MSIEYKIKDEIRFLRVVTKGTCENLNQLKENLDARKAVDSLTDDLLERIEKILDNDPLNHD